MPLHISTKLLFRDDTNPKMGRLTHRTLESDCKAYRKPAIKYFAKLYDWIRKFPVSLENVGYLEAVASFLCGRSLQAYENWPLTDNFPNTNDLRFTILTERISEKAGLWRTESRRIVGLMYLTMHYARSFETQHDYEDLAEGLGPQTLDDFEECFDNIQDDPKEVLRRVESAQIPLPECKLVDVAYVDSDYKRVTHAEIFAAHLRVWGVSVEHCQYIERLLLKYAYLKTYYSETHQLWKVSGALDDVLGHYFYEAEYGIAAPRQCWVKLVECILSGYGYPAWAKHYCDYHYKALAVMKNFVTFAEITDDDMTKLGLGTFWPNYGSHQSYGTSYDYSMGSLFRAIDSEYYCECLANLLADDYHVDRRQIVTLFKLVAKVSAYQHHFEIRAKDWQFMLHAAVDEAMSNLKSATWALPSYHLHLMIKSLAVRDKGLECYAATQAAKHNKIMHMLNGNSKFSKVKLSSKPTPESDVANILAAQLCNFDVVSFPGTTLHVALPPFIADLEVNIIPNTEGTDTMYRVQESRLYRIELLEDGERSEDTICHPPTLFWTALLAALKCQEDQSTITIAVLLSALSSTKQTFVNGELHIHAADKPILKPAIATFLVRHPASGAVMSLKPREIVIAEPVEPVLEKEEVTNAKAGSAIMPEAHALRQYTLRKHHTEEINDRLAAPKTAGGRDLYDVKAWQEWNDVKEKVRPIIFGRNHSGVTKQIAQYTYSYYASHHTDDPECNQLRTEDGKGNATDSQYITTAKKKRRVQGRVADEGDIVAGLGNLAARPSTASAKAKRRENLQRFDDLVWSKLTKTTSKFGASVHEAFVVATNCGMSASQRRKFVESRFGGSAMWVTLDSVRQGFEDRDGSCPIGAVLAYFVFSSQDHVGFISQLATDMQASARVILNALGTLPPITAADSEWVRKLSQDGDVELHPGPCGYEICWNRYMHMINGNTERVIYVTGAPTQADQNALGIKYVEIGDPVEQQESLMSGITDVLGALNTPQYFNQAYTMPREDLIKKLNTKEIKPRTRQEAAVLRHIIDTRSKKKDADAKLLTDLSATAFTSDSTSGGDFLTILNAASKLVNKVAKSPEYSPIVKAINAILGMKVIDDTEEARPRRVEEVPRAQIGEAALVPQIGNAAPVAEVPVLVQPQDDIIELVDPDPRSVEELEQEETRHLGERLTRDYKQVAETFGLTSDRAWRLKQPLIEAYLQTKQDADRMGEPPRDFVQFVGIVLKNGVIPLNTRSAAEYYMDLYLQLRPDNGNIADGLAANLAESRAHNALMHATNGNIDGYAMAQASVHNQLMHALNGNSSTTTDQLAYNISNAYQSDEMDKLLCNGAMRGDKPPTLMTKTEVPAGSPITLDDLATMAQEWERICRHNVQNISPQTTLARNEVVYYNKSKYTDTTNGRFLAPRGPISLIASALPFLATSAVNGQYSYNMGLDIALDNKDGCFEVETEPYYANIESYFVGGANANVELNRTNQTVSGYTVAAWTEAFQNEIQLAYKDGGFSFMDQCTRLWCLAMASAIPDTEVSSFMQTYKQTREISTDSPVSATQSTVVNFGSDVTVQFMTQGDFFTWASANQSPIRGYVYMPPLPVLAAGGPLGMAAYAKSIIINMLTIAPPCVRRNWACSLRNDDGRVISTVYTSVWDNVVLNSVPGVPNRITVVLPGAPVGNGTTAAMFYGPNGANANLPMNYVYQGATTYSLQAIAASWLPSITYADVLAVIDANQKVWGCGSDVIQGFFLAASMLRYPLFRLGAWNDDGTIADKAGPLIVNGAGAWSLFTNWGAAINSPSNSIMPLIRLPRRIVGLECWMHRCVKKIKKRSIADLSSFMLPSRTRLAMEIFSDTIMTGTQEMLSTTQITSNILRTWGNAPVAGAPPIYGWMLKALSTSLWTTMISNHVKMFSSWDVSSIVRRFGWQNMDLRWGAGTSYYGDPSQLGTPQEALPPVFIDPTYLVQLGHNLPFNSAFAAPTPPSPTMAFARFTFFAPAGWTFEQLPPNPPTTPFLGGDDGMRGTRNFSPDNTNVLKLARMNTIASMIWGKKYTYGLKTNSMGLQVYFYYVTPPSLQDYWVKTAGGSPLASITDVWDNNYIVSPKYYQHHVGQYVVYMTDAGSPLAKTLYTGDIAAMWYKMFTWFNNVRLNSWNTTGLYVDGMFKYLAKFDETPGIVTETTGIEKKSEVPKETANSSASGANSPITVAGGEPPKI
jgi:hypothetical protein